MHDKKVKLIYFSLANSQSKEIEFTFKAFNWLLAGLFAVMLGAVSVLLFVSTDFYQDLQVSSLTKANKQLEAELLEMGTKLVKIQGRVNDLEKQDDDLRVIAALPRIDSDVREVGIGGTGNATLASISSNSPLPDQVVDYKETLDKLERRIELTTVSQSEVMTKIYENKKIMKHTPSIWPVLGGQVKDKFGMRLHPITDRVRMHKGIDIAAESGTEVFAAAAGVVVDALSQKNGYGKHVIIDHGDGLKTLYGHLSKILVRKGDRVDRWNPIGLVGKTGLATGPHLHYEVQRNDKAQDPIDYMLNMEQQ